MFQTELAVAWKIKLNLASFSFRYRLCLTNTDQSFFEQEESK